MSPLDTELELDMSRLEREWRGAYDASIALRADYQAFAANPHADAASLDLLRERMERAEAHKGRLMALIERHEGRILQDSLRPPAPSGS